MAIPGKAAVSPIMARAISKKGKEPRKISDTAVLGPPIPWITNRFRPTGGVTNPISINNTSITPNQTKSNPRLLRSGSIKGTVTNVNEIPSMKENRGVKSSFLTYIIE